MAFSKQKYTWMSRSVMLFIGMILGATVGYTESQGILSQGDAAVTGFSGVNRETNGSIVIDEKGPSVRIMTLPGSGGFGFRNNLKPFTVTAHDVGQVFGITLDNASQPNIFVAATTAYGLGIYKPNVGRLKHGEPGAQFMPGQFGPTDLGGGPGSIWRIDGVSGQVTLFANIIYNGIENSPAALGGLAFDSVSNQLFVADRTSGVIHRLAMDGSEKGVFDHGVQGLTAIGQEPVPFDMSTLANIHDVKFDVENPQSWGLAPPPRRVFALAVYGARLYYSVYGSQIWSIGIANDGSFVDDARIEVDVRALQADSEISSITFDELGYMYIAERGAPTGDYTFIQIANSDKNRAMRFVPKNPTNDSPTFWVEPGDEYAMGMPVEYQNANGGVALTCGRTVWSTGDHLMDTGAANAPHINGLQGNDKELLKPANMPPLKSWFVNYYDMQANPNSRGYMGALVISTFCSQPSTSVKPSVETTTTISTPTPRYAPPVPEGFTCESGVLVDGLCLVYPLCPNGTVFSDGYCVYPNCPSGLVRINNVCVPPPVLCGYGRVFINGYCVPVGCPRGLERGPYGYCRCADNFYYRHGHCSPPPSCPPNQQYRDGRCIPTHHCTSNRVDPYGRCIPKKPCPPQQIYRQGRCIPLIPCPPQQMYRHGQCMPVLQCPPNQRYQDGRCLPGSQCGQNQMFRDGRCWPNAQCPPNQQLINGKCMFQNLKPTCQPGQTYRDGRCFTPQNIPHKIPDNRPRPGHFQNTPNPGQPGGVYQPRPKKVLQPLPTRPNIEQQTAPVYPPKPKKVREQTPAHQEPTPKIERPRPIQPKPKKVLSPRPVYQPNDNNEPIKVMPRQPLHRPYQPQQEKVAPPVERKPIPRATEPQRISPPVEKAPRVEEKMSQPKHESVPEPMVQPKPETPPKEEMRATPAQQLKAE